MQKFIIKKKNIIFLSSTFVFVSVLSFLSLDPDFGWHLSAGQYYLDFGLPNYDIFTYTASNFPWINHEWLSDIIWAYLFNIGGYALLAILIGAIWTISAYLLSKRVSLFVLSLALIGLLPYLGVRAASWTILAVTILVSLVSSDRYRKYLPFLFLVWTNLHGSFVIGLVYIAYEAIKNKNLNLIKLLLICILVTLVNPYGVNIYREVFSTLFDSSLRWTINEWRPLGIEYAMVPYIALWASMFLLADIKKWRSYFGLDVILFVASLSSFRYFMIFILLSVSLTENRLRSVLLTIPRKLDRNRQRFVDISKGAIFAAIALLIYAQLTNSPLTSQSYYPVEAVNYLTKNSCDGNLFNSYNYGGYLIWKLPGQKLYIDGRMPSWQYNGHKYFDDYLKVLSDDDFRKSEFARYNISCVLVPNYGDAAALSTRLKDEGWRVGVKTNSSTLLIK